MAKILKWLVFLSAASLLVLAGVALGLHSWVGSDGFRERMAREASAALGAPVTLDGIEVALWPVPAVAVNGIRIEGKPGLSLARLEARPRWNGMLQGRLEIATLVLRDAVLPQPAVDALLLGLRARKKQEPAAPVAAAPPAPPSAGAPELPADVARWLPRRALLQRVRWISAKGVASTIDAEMKLGEDGLLDEAQVTVLDGHYKDAKASLQREEPRDAADSWAVRVDIGGGNVTGRIGVQEIDKAPGGPAIVLKGELETQGVEVSALTAPDRPLSGRLDASTTLQARAATLTGLVEALQTQTRFSVKEPVVHGLDLVKAVQTVGLSRGGQTRLDALAGQVHTNGRSAQVNNLVASSGALSLTGQVAVSPARALSGRLSVNLSAASKIGSVLGGAIGVPLTVSGSLDAPEVTLTRGALLGAAIGTAVMPGAGTGAGLQLGDKVGQGLKKLFGK
ncbi:MAG: hypothetical protein Q7T70_00145 [Polaromonas sp.]|nr:hypothetical protein [Polaromonas sp.]